MIINLIKLKSMGGATSLFNRVRLTAFYLDFMAADERMPSPDKHKQKQVTTQPADLRYEDG